MTETTPSLLAVVRSLDGVDHVKVAIDPIDASQPITVRFAGPASPEAVRAAITAGRVEVIKDEVAKLVPDSDGWWLLDSGSDLGVAVLVHDPTGDGLQFDWGGNSNNTNLTAYAWRGRLGLVAKPETFPCWGCGEDVPPALGACDDPECKANRNRGPLIGPDNPDGRYADYEEAEPLALALDGDDARRLVTRLREEMSDEDLGIGPGGDVEQLRAALRDLAASYIIAACESSGVIEPGEWDDAFGDLDLALTRLAPPLADNAPAGSIRALMALGLLDGAGDVVDAEFTVVEGPAGVSCLDSAEYLSATPAGACRRVTETSGGESLTFEDDRRLPAASEADASELAKLEAVVRKMFDGNFGAGKFLIGGLEVIVADPRYMTAVPGGINVTTSQTSRAGGE